VAGSYLLFHLAFHDKIRCHNFAKHGDLSYGIYLYGWPIQALVMFYLREYINPYSFFFIALPIAFTAAYCSWHLIEKPFLLFKNNKKSAAPVSKS
jgi:peptidoglycan/LPS O-acetylase OafA/YrhL